MSLRISDAHSLYSAVAIACALSLAGCDKPDDATVTRAETAQRAAAGEVMCARGDAPLAKTCSLARAQTAQGLILTISHPNGGFRRLRVTQDGRGVAAADGAEPALIRIAGEGVIDITIGADHFQLPATIGQPTAS